MSIAQYLSQQVKTFKAGEVIFRQGELGEYGLLIESGIVEVFSENNKNSSIKQDEITHFRKAYPGEIIGELAMLDHAPRSATCVAKNEVKALIIYPEQFEARLKQADPMLQYLIELLVKRFRSETSLLAGVKTSSIAEYHAIKLKEIASGVVKKILLESKLSSIIAQDKPSKKLRVLFEPIVLLENSKVVGFEAMLDSNEMNIQQLLEVADETELTIELAYFFVKNAVADFKRILDSKRYEGSLFLSLNCTVKQLTHIPFLKFLISTLKQHEISLNALHIEVEETGHSDIRDSVDWLVLCQKAGFGVTIDHFGTGSANFHFLIRFPVTAIKLDQTFSDLLGGNSSENAQGLISGMIALKDKTSLSVMACGVKEKVSCQ